MSEIIKHTGDNLPGIKKIEYCFDSEISSEEVNLIDNEITINFVSEKDWKKIYFTPETVVTNLDDEEQTPAGIIYNNSLNFKVPKERKEVSAKLLSFNSKNFIFKLTTQNGSILIVGRKDNPIIKIGNLKLNTGFSGYELNFTGQNHHPVLFLV